MSGVVFVDQPSQVVVVEPQPSVTVVASGEQGPPGPPGLDRHYEHIQSLPADTWTIDHPLGKKPAVTVIDSAGDQVEGDVSYVGTLRVVLRFSAPFAGVAVLN